MVWQKQSWSTQIPVPEIDDEEVYENFGSQTEATEDETPLQSSAMPAPQNSRLSLRVLYNQVATSVPNTNKRV